MPVAVDAVEQVATIPTPNSMMRSESIVYSPYRGHSPTLYPAAMHHVPSFDFQEHHISGFLKGVMTPHVPEGACYSSPAWADVNAGFNTRGLLDFTMEGGFDFNDADFGFIDQLCSDPNSMEPHVQPMLAQALDALGMDNPRKHVALGAEAYKRSSLSVWEPRQEDSIAVELEDLSALGTDHGSPETSPTTAPTTTQATTVTTLNEYCVRERLSRPARDKFLGMILNHCRLERSHFAIKAFPTPEVLDDLVQGFFFHHRRQIDSYMHTPSFRPNELRPELLGGIVAWGAVLTDIVSVQKLGFAIQETVRTTIPTRCEESNARTRQLWIVQSFMCEIEIGLWSGIKRKTEIAESHTQTLYTVCPVLTSYGHD